MIGRVNVPSIVKNIVEGFSSGDKLYEKDYNILTPTTIKKRISKKNIPELGGDETIKNACVYNNFLIFSVHEYGIFSVDMRTMEYTSLECRHTITNLCIKDGCVVIIMDKVVAVTVVVFDIIKLEDNIIYETRIPSSNGEIIDAYATKDAFYILCNGSTIIKYSPNGEEIKRNHLGSICNGLLVDNEKSILITVDTECKSIYIMDLNTLTVTQKFDYNIKIKSVNIYKYENDYIIISESSIIKILNDNGTLKKIYERSVDSDSKNGHKTCAFHCSIKNNRVLFNLKDDKIRRMCLVRGSMISDVLSNPKYDKDSAIFCLGSGFDLFSIATPNIVKYLCVPETILIS